MKPEELSDHIGEIDDELIAGAKKKRSTNKKIFLITGSIAACALIAVTVVFLVSRQNTVVETRVPFAGGYTEKGADTEKDMTPMPVKVFFVSNGKIESIKLAFSPQTKAIFEGWKHKNNIGDDVKFISATIENDSGIEELDYSDQGVAKYLTGDNYIYNLTITKNIEFYYSRIDKELLLDSLKKTMLGATGKMKINEYNLILVEG